MSDSWYYVIKGQRLGPVDAGVMAELIRDEQLTDQDYVWKKGFENWRKLAEVPELSGGGAIEIERPTPAPSPMTRPVAAAVAAAQPKAAGPAIPQMGDIPADRKCVFVRIGPDRGGAAAEYGPYTPALMKKLYTENRINGRTQFYIQDKMQEWAFLADLADFEEVFNDVPPMIQEIERRKHVRKPLVARMLVQNDKKIYEGVCRDISIGGMQVLTNDFPGRAGDRISINVHPDNTDYHFTAAGQVVRVLDGGQGFSFRFDGISNEAQRVIEKYIANVDQAL